MPLPVELSLAARRDPSIDAGIGFGSIRRACGSATRDVNEMTVALPARRDLAITLLLYPNDGADQTGSDAGRRWKKVRHVSDMVRSISETRVHNGRGFRVSEEPIDN